MKIKMFHCLHRINISASDLTALRSQCEVTEDPINISGERLRRYTLRGVPAKQVDVALPMSHQGLEPLVLEIGEKLGKFDGAKRLRLTIRHWHNSLKDAGIPIPKGKILIDRRENTSEAVEEMSRHVGAGNLQNEPILRDALEEAGSVFNLAILWEGGHWSGSWVILKSDLADYNLSAVVMWHWNRYYQFLPFEEVQLLAQSFEASHPEIKRLTLAEANRLASRDLYRLARDLGWRKLTLREANKFSLSQGWHPTENVVKRISEIYPGVGQYTQEAASGVVPIKDYVQTSYGTVVVE